MDKLNEYQGFTGRFHGVKDNIKEHVTRWKNDHPQGVCSWFSRDADNRAPPKEERMLQDYPHIYRRKTWAELVRVSAAVMGIEFGYSAETAFVSPILLKIGVKRNNMSMVWGLSPLIGFFVTPILGSVSDTCQSKWGRRRPFILLLSLGILIGLLLVPNGQYIGEALGEFYPSTDANQTNRNASDAPLLSDANYPHPWGIGLTILGTVLLDFNADSCQSPSRAYLLDTCLPEDHARGLSTFTVMAGLGGFFGYALGGINWQDNAIGKALGGNIRAVFTLITILFVICIVYTVTCFKELPLKLLEQNRELHEKMMSEASGEMEITKIGNSDGGVPSYGTNGPSSSARSPVKSSLEVPELKQYLLSIIFMPLSLRLLCLTNLFCWMAHVSYSLYFTDFVGEAIFQGDPTAPMGSKERQLFEDGVMFGCWGMAMYSLSCSCYSLIIEKLIKRFRARNVYMGSLLFYSFGMALMALTRTKVGVIIFSWAAGVIYSTLFTVPYLLVAHYHATGIFAKNAEGEVTGETKHRGLGTDVAIVGSMVFLAQFILSLVMGSIITWAETTTAVVSTASILAFLGACSAYFVEYLDI